MHLPGMQPRELRSVDIRRIVRERLAGLMVRQWDRDQRRARRRKKKPAAADDRQGVLEIVAELERAAEEKRRKEAAQMRSPIVFRAVFQQPRGTFRMKAAVAVEVYHERIGPPAEWRARVPDTKILFTNISGQGTPSVLRSQIRSVHFERCLEEWQAYDISQTPPRKLENSDWKEAADGKVELTDRYRGKLEAERTAAMQAAARPAAGAPTPQHSLHLVKDDSSK